MSRKVSIFLLSAVTLVLVLNMIKGGEPQHILSLSEFLLIAAAAVWLYFMVASREMRFRSSIVSLPAFLFAGALFVSSLLSVNAASSFKGLHEVISYLVIFFICLNLPGREERRVLAYMLVGVAVIQAVIAIAQGATGTERVGGTLVYPTYLIDTLIVGLSLLGGFVLFSQRKRLPSLVLYGSGILITFVALFLTRARAGLLVLAVSFIILGVMRSRKVLAILIAVIIAASVIPNPVRDRILDAGKSDIYAMKRPSIWKQAIQIIRTEPSYGIGMRNYVYYSRMTNFPVENAVGRYAKVANIAHNQYLHYGATTGLAGAAAFLLLVGAIVVSGVRSARSRDPVAVGSLAAFSAILVHSLVDNAIYLPLNGYIFFILGGILCSTGDRTRVFRPPPRAKIYVCLLAAAYGLMVVRPAVSSYFYSSALRRAGRNEIREAIRSCRRALVVSPREAAYHNALAKLYTVIYEETKGAGYLFIIHQRHGSAIKANPLDEVFWEDFADFTFDHRRDIGEEEALNNAAKLLREAVKVDPYNPFLRRKLATVYIEGGSNDKAVRELKNALSIEPNFYSGRFMLAEIYASMGLEERAQEQQSILRAKRLEHLELHAQNEYEKKLITLGSGINF